MGPEDIVNPDIPPELHGLAFDMQLIVKHNMQDLYVQAAAATYDQVMGYLKSAGYRSAAAHIENLRSATLLTMAQSITESRG